MPSIRAIVSDLDGTLLNHHSELSPENESAIREAIDAGLIFCIATGKTHYSGRMVRERLRLTSPGVYIQGLQIWDASGAILQNLTLDRSAARDVVAVAKEAGRPALIYSGDKLYTNFPQHQRADFAKYHEPPLIVIENLIEIVDSLEVNKVVLQDEPAHIALTRAALAERLQGRGHVTQATIDHCEVLPPGSSKGAGVRHLLGLLGVAPAETLALGDAENDLEMIELAGIGVAVSNAHPKLKAISDYIAPSNDENGVAEAIRRFALNGHPI